MASRRWCEHPVHKETVSCPFITTKDGTEHLLQGLGQRAACRLQPRLAARASTPGKTRCSSLAGQRRTACIAHDRRGHGRSGQPWAGNEMDTYADDLAALGSTATGLDKAVHVGHSTGGGEVARYIGGHGTKPRGEGCADWRRAPADAQDGAPTRAACRSESVRPHSRRHVSPTGRNSSRTSSGPFYGGPSAGPARTSRRGCATRSGCQGMWAGFGFPPMHQGVFQKPTSPRTSSGSMHRPLFVHGDDDQIVPIGAIPALLSSKLIRGSTLKVYRSARTAWPPRIRTRSTPTCWPSSRPSSPGRPSPQQTPILRGHARLLVSFSSQARRRCGAADAVEGCRRGCSGMSVCPYLEAAVRPWKYDQSAVSFPA